MPETETVQRNNYILDQDTDPTAQLKSLNLIHRRKEQLLGHLLSLPVYTNKVFRRKHKHAWRKRKLKLIPEKCYEVKFAASLIPLTQPKLSAHILKLNLVRHMRFGQKWRSQANFKAVPEEVDTLLYFSS